MDFFTKLFLTDDWPPRCVCGEWSTFREWLYITSDIAVWLSYFVIPAIIIFFHSKAIQSAISTSFLAFWGVYNSLWKYTPD